MLINKIVEEKVSDSIIKAYFLNMYYLDLSFLYCVIKEPNLEIFKFSLYLWL